MLNGESACKGQPGDYQTAKLWFPNGGRGTPKVVDVAGVDCDPESRPNASCYCQETINKNEGNVDDGRIGEWLWLGG